jgi:hypothetical protein
MHRCSNERKLSRASFIEEQVNDAASDAATPKLRQQQVEQFVFNATWASKEFGMASVLLGHANRSNVERRASFMLSEYLIVDRARRPSYVERPSVTDVAHHSRVDEESGKVGSVGPFIGP